MDLSDVNAHDRGPPETILIRLNSNHDSNHDS